MVGSKSSFGLILILLAALLAGVFLWRHFNEVPTGVAYVSEEGGAISVIDLKSLKVIRRVQTGELAPRGIAVTFDGQALITSNKNTSDIAIFSTPRLQLLRRVHIGNGPEFVKLNPSGTRVFATFEPAAEKEGHDAQVKGTDESQEPPAQIASFHVGDWTEGPISTAGLETESIEFSGDGKQMLVANEAQDTLGIFDAESGTHLRDVNVKPYGSRPRGVKRSPQGDAYAVTMEASGTLLLMDTNLNLLKSLPTAAKPYGVAFDRAGQRIFVAAAMAHKLQVFSRDSLQLLAEVPVGQRCWHFTFTPDDSKVLMACGRSNNIVVVDANSYKPLSTIEGFKLPWGIVTYPRSYGSLGLP